MALTPPDNSAVTCGTEDPLLSFTGDQTDEGAVAGLQECVESKITAGVGAGRDGVARVIRLHVFWSLVPRVSM